MIAAELAPLVSLPEDSAAHMLIVVRWLHIVTGIVWVGLLYFFNLVNMRMMRDLDAALRREIVPRLMPRTLWWFRWASVATVLTGIWYWMTIVGADRRNAVAQGVADVSGGWAINSFFLLWTLAFVVYMGVLMSPAGRSTVAVYATAAVVVIAASYLYLATNTHGWESNRLLAIGVGGGMGWFMMFNVWGVIWRAQKKLIRWSGDAEMPAEAARQSHMAYVASRVNFVLSFPMLFFMAAASHYPMLG